ncbi:MAG: response regulator transcription factor [Muribaculaceae bacterium]|nr:response regulator transcription factor [Muribaculaceae bacterium]
MTQIPKNIINIAIAESSPIISAGVTHTVGRLPGLNVRATEVASVTDLYNYLRTDSVDILIVNPYFDDSFDTVHVREINKNIKIVAIVSSALERKKKESFDDIIFISDDVETICEKIKALSSQDVEPNNKEPLSNREKEIIVLVVKGMTNKEIADTLFLSVHTVITHRRNIARKLEIHSATGLTIYAIVNKLVDIADLHL